MKTLATPVLLLSALLTFAASPADNLALRSLSPPVLLPDGKEFKTWEEPLTFTRTYYVAGSSPAASDANPGTQDKPFATINKAAQVLQPGERVVVAAAFIANSFSPRVAAPVRTR